MENDQEKQCSGAIAVKEVCRLFCSTFLSLLPPLLLLLFARISAARHQTWPPPNNNEQPYTISIFLHTKTTLILSLLVFAAAIAAVIQGFVGERCSWLVCERRRLHGAVVCLFSMQVCMSLWIHGVVEGDRIGGENFGTLIFFRSLVLALGLHAMVVLWRRNVVTPVVNEAMFGLSDEGFSTGWVEDVVLAAAVGCLWWQRVRREAEELVVVRRDVEVEVEVVDVVGWLVYGLTAALGGVRVVKGLLWVVNRIFRPVNGKVGAVNKSFDLKVEVKVFV